VRHADKFRPKPLQPLKIVTRKRRKSSTMTRSIMSLPERRVNLRLSLEWIASEKRLEERNGRCSVTRLVSKLL
jgi:hypothetical protein